MMNNRQTRLAILLTASLAGVLLVSLAAYSGVAAPLVQAIRSVTPTRTGLVTPTPTSLTQVLQRQLSFGGAGGGGSPNDPGVVHVYYVCPNDPPAGTKSPTIIPLSRSDSEFGGLCLYGFPQDEDLTLRLTSPDGRSDITGVFRKGDYNADYDVQMLEQVKPPIGFMAGGVMGATSGGMPYTGVTLWEPEGLSEGRWEVEARTSRLAAKTKFQVKWSDKDPRLHIVQSQAGILSRPADYEPITGLNCRVVTANDKVKIVGANFPANTSIPIGVYRKTGAFDWTFNTNLVSQTTIQTDRSGNYRGDWLVSPKLAGGRYFLVSVLYPELTYQYSPAVCVTVTWQACPKLLPSRLSPGLWGKVLEEPPQANNVRTTASRSGKISGKIEPGGFFKVLSGPQCSDGWVWWYVETPEGLKGWTAEGNEKMYWVSP